MMFFALLCWLLSGAGLIYIMWHFNCTQMNFIKLIMWLQMVTGCTWTNLGVSEVNYILMQKKFGKLYWFFTLQDGRPDGGLDGGHQSVSCKAWHTLIHIWGNLGHGENMQNSTGLKWIEREWNQDPGSVRCYYAICGQKYVDTRPSSPTFGHNAGSKLLCTMFLYIVMLRFSFIRPKRPKPTPEDSAPLHKTSSVSLIPEGFG